MVLKAMRLNVITKDKHRQKAAEDQGGCHMTLRVQEEKDQPINDTEKNEPVNFREEHKIWCSNS